MICPTAGIYESDTLEKFRKYKQINFNNPALPSPRCCFPSSQSLFRNPLKPLVKATVWADFPTFFFLNPNTILRPSMKHYQFFGSAARHGYFLQPGHRETESEEVSRLFYSPISLLPLSSLSINPESNCGCLLSSSSLNISIASPSGILGRGISTI